VQGTRYGEFVILGLAVLEPYCEAFQLGEGTGESGECLGKVCVIILSVNMFIRGLFGVLKELLVPKLLCNAWFP
jgi:hypothetical protein